ncbi:aminotransferase class I/II-fold pyridoxal phosphate-dependent enzyme [Variovorax sp. efr-133-TYG-130]|uniref:aminotransferase class I/II-fold pyridoxal phosphate-dependent enzyme n=1 Tax=Variovorax sp. efr-133-TYG-130 TaxID=3040327 RepID=UPI003305EF7D
MSTLLAQRLFGVKPSPSMAAKTRVDAMRAAGRRIVDFTIGEPDFPTPRHIVDGGVAALLAGQTRYTASNGTPALRQAIADKLQRENALAFKPENIAVGNGAKHIIYNAFAATLNAGDEVIVPAPYWVSYPDMVALHGGTAVVVPSSQREGFKLTPAALGAAITPRTRWLVLNTPNNPTGAVYTRGELAALGEVLKRHPHVWLMTDEIYEHFVYGDAVHVSPLGALPELAERTLLINGVSKAYAMTGWRIGYGAGPVSLIKAITMLLSQSTSCPSSIGQAAAVIALEGPQESVGAAAALFGSRRDRMVQLLREVSGLECAPPDGAFYVFPSVAGLIGRTTPEGSVLSSDVDVVHYFLEHASVATIDGTSYGMPNHLRMSFATGVDVIEQGCSFLQDAVRDLS